MNLKVTLQQMYSGKNITEYRQWFKTSSTDEWWHVEFDDGTYDNKAIADINAFYTANQSACDAADLQNQIQQAILTVKAAYNPVDVALNQNGEQDAILQAISDIQGATDATSLQTAQTAAITAKNNIALTAQKASINTVAQKIT